MIIHIVMWKLKEIAEGASKEENAFKIKEKLEALKHKIGGFIAAVTEKRVVADYER